MARAKLRVVVQDRDGDVVPGAAVAVYDQNTINPISVTMYADAVGGGTVANPLLADNDGIVEAYLDVPRRVDLAISGGGLSATIEDAAFEPDPAGATVGVSATEYGALGDGVADDGPEIQAAIDAVKAALVGALDGGIVNLTKGTYLTNQQIQLKDHVRLVGEGSAPAKIKAGPSFPINTALLRIGDGTSPSGVYHTRAENLSLDCNDVAGSIGVYSTEAQELSGVWHCQITNYRNKGIHFETSGAQNWTLRDLFMYCSALGTTAIGIHLVTGSKNAIENLTIAAAGNVDQTGTAILIDGSFVFVRNFHPENYADGVRFTNGGSGGVINAFGHSTVPDLIHIESNCPHVFLAAIHEGVPASAVTVRDDRNGLVVTDVVVSLYSASPHTYLPGLATQTTVGATGAASALPANPEGYLRVFIAGVERAVPYYKRV